MYYCPSPTKFPLSLTSPQHRHVDAYHCMQHSACRSLVVHLSPKAEPNSGNTKRKTSGPDNHRSFSERAARTIFQEQRKRKYKQLHHGTRAIRNRTSIMLNYHREQKIRVFQSEPSYTELFLKSFTSLTIKAVGSANLLSLKQFPSSSAEYDQIPN